MRKTNLRKRYEAICEEYVSIFCKKHDMDFGGWVGDEIGGVAYCNDYFFNFSDIALDIDSKQPKGLIIEWQDDNIQKPKKAINYYSYTKGLRISQIK